MGLVTNFTSFAPLGTVLVALLGVGVAERAGLLSAAIRALVLGAPRNLLTAVVVFAAVVSSFDSKSIKTANQCVCPTVQGYSKFGFANFSNPRLEIENFFSSDVGT